MSLLPCQQGQVVTIRITTEQLRLLGRASKCASKLGQRTFPRTVEEQEELTDLQYCINDAVNDPGAPDTVHGFAL